ncbi:hypothetical protein FRC01_007092, partial [Tulasnella sp. 417]
MAHPAGVPVPLDSISTSTARAGINSTLPPELLALAFSFLVNEALDAISFKSPRGPDQAEVQRRFRQHPLSKPSLVCRAWYTIVKETPKFWAFVAVGLGPPAWSLTKAATSSRRQDQSKKIKSPLERSGRLPLTIVIYLHYVQSFDSLSRAIHKHFDRLETLSLILSDSPPLGGIGPRSMQIRTTVQQALSLLPLRMPGLKLLSITGCLKPLVYGIGGRLPGVEKAVDAPQLETLSCHTHLIIPQSPTRLLSLSLNRVDLDQPGRRSVELPHLVELRIEDCKAGAILSTFLTPSLRRLFVESWEISGAPVQLPRYDNLQELQWMDTGADPVFVTLFRRCPNLKRYLNYIEADDIEKDTKAA